MKKRIGSILGLLLCAAMAFGQTPVVRDSITATSTSPQPAGTVAVAQFNNQIGSAIATFEYVPGGTIGTASNVLRGCMRGGTCDILETSTTTTATKRTVVGLYDYFTITPTFTGGASPTLTVNMTMIPGGVINQNAVFTGAGVANSPLMDSSGRLIFVGSGAGNGLAQAASVFALPNPISATVPTTVALNAAVTTPINLKATVGQLYALEIQNPNASVCFLQVFDVVQGSVTLGTTAPKFSVPLLSSGEKYLSNIPFGLLQGSTGISVAATTTSNGLTTCATGLVVSSWVQ